MSGSRPATAAIRAYTPSCNGCRRRVRRGAGGGKGRRHADRPDQRSRAIGLDGRRRASRRRTAQFLTGLGIGAPPDLFNPQGQDWGLTSFSPQALVAGGFAPFIATLRANMRHAGGVRIDHAMGLMRLWLVPHGARPSEGAYLSYPLDDLLRLLALESHRHNAIVIGEDLGTVPPSFRARCREAGIAGMDVLWFQRERERFLAPRRVARRCGRHDHDARPADRRRLVAWHRPRTAPRHRHRRRSPRSRSARPNAAALWQAFTDAGVASGAAPPERTTPIRSSMRPWSSSPRRQGLWRSSRSKTSWASPSSRICRARPTSIPTGAAASAFRWMRCCASPRPRGASACCKRSARHDTARHAAAAVPQGVHLRRCRGAGALLRRARRQPSLRLADHHGARGLAAWL